MRHACEFEVYFHLEELVELTSRNLLDSELFYPAAGFQEQKRLGQCPLSFLHCCISDCSHPSYNETLKNHSSSLKK